MTRSASSLLVLIGLVLLAAIIAAGCTGSVVTPAIAGDIKKVSSTDEIRDYIENNTALAGAEDNQYATNGAGVWQGAAMPASTSAPRAAVAESAMAKGDSVILQS